MALDTAISVPAYSGNVDIQLKSGSSIVFVGANGSGKTRLGVFIDVHFSSNGDVESHRIAAHRSLNLNPDIVPSTREAEEKNLHYGSGIAKPQGKFNNRWHGKAATRLLSDFDNVLKTLYAENNDVSISFRQECLKNTSSLIEVPPAKIDKLKMIWESVLPHRELVISGNNVRTKTKDGNEYSASDMSDGERVIFYLIGQALLARPNTVLIFDEPELHINKSILLKLWDVIEVERSDCAFIYITHDVDFSASRHSATIYALRDYRKEPNEAWDIKLIPEQSELPEDILVMIIGSRKPVLFVEGEKGSLDLAVYRRVYTDYTVIPVGSCEHVIHTVTSFASRRELHRVGCAGIVDADSRTDEEAAWLKERHIYQLPVSEIENLFLLPKVFIAIAKKCEFDLSERKSKLQELVDTIFQQAQDHIDTICLRHTRRRIDTKLKKITLDDDCIDVLEQNLSQLVQSIDVKRIFEKEKNTLQDAIDNKRFKDVLRHYDNKGLIAESAKILSMGKKDHLVGFLKRLLRTENSSILHKAISSYLPDITAS